MNYSLYRPYVQLGSRLSSLPPTINQLLGLPTIDLNKETLRRYSSNQNIREEDLGGSLDESASRANNDRSGAELAGSSNGKPRKVSEIEIVTKQLFEILGCIDRIKSM